MTRQMNMTKEEFGELSAFRKVSGHLKSPARHLPTARVWPPNLVEPRNMSSEDDADLLLPPLTVQRYLIDLYFTYFHPTFPVLHKASFMAQYNAWQQSGGFSSPLALA